MPLQARSSTVGKSGRSRSKATQLELAQQVSQAAYANLQLYRAWGRQPAASASFKLDGFPIVAFVWQGQLFTCTGRMLNSEQVRAT